MRTFVTTVSAAALAAAALLAMPSLAFAQRDRTPQVLIGARIAEIDFKSPPTLGADWRIGIAAGVDFPVPIGGESSRVSFHPEALFVQDGTKVQGVFDEQIRLNYIEGVAALELAIMPVLHDHNRVLLEVAPTVRLLTGATSRINGESIALTQEINRVEPGYMVGFKINVLPKKLDVGVRYEAGLRDVYKDGFADAKNRSLMIFVTPHIIPERD